MVKPKRNGKLAEKVVSIGDGALDKIWKYPYAWGLAFFLLAVINVTAKYYSAIGSLVFLAMGMYLICKYITEV